MVRLPQGEDWKDHAIPCPCCKEPVLTRNEHYQDGTRIDPGWWSCDEVEEEEEVNALVR